VTLRANSLRTTRDELIRRLAEREIRSRAGSFARDAVVLEDKADVFALPEFSAGLFEMQDEGSQLVAELVAPPPGSLVVDACAGAGGKTLALSALLRGKGSVLATDVSRAKVIELRRRARRAGAANVRAIVASAQVRPPELGRLAAKVRRVLVDAPCSGIGALRRNPEARWRLAAADVLRLAGLQEEIAAASLDLLAPGGRLVYATCTCLRAENQDVVAALLARGPGLEIVPLGEILGGELARKVADPSGSFLTLTPDRHGTDGFFAAVLRRRRRP
jgi:16S rRNA (cytosine967-C5)-methyltransferase